MLLAITSELVHLRNVFLHIRSGNVEIKRSQPLSEKAQVKINLIQLFKVFTFRHSFFSLLLSA